MTEYTALVRRVRRHTLGDLLHRSAARWPGKTAVVGADAAFTYAEFDTVVNRVASVLAAHGIRKGDRLALVSHNSWHYVAINFATARLGVVLVPVNFMLQTHEVAYVLGHCMPAAVIVEDSLIPIVDPAIVEAGLGAVLRAGIPLAGTIVPGWEDVAAWCADGLADPPEVWVDDDDPLRIMYTSGTESRPKGVVLSSRSLISQYASCIVDGGMSGDDIEVHALPLYHCAQLDCFLSVDIYLGATSVILPSPEPTVLLAALATHRATKLFCPPTVWISLLRHPDFDATDLTALRKCYYGASAMPKEVLVELQRRLPGVRLWNFYGQTELAPVATILQPHEQLDHAGSAGRAALNVETRVVDDLGRAVAPDTVGEIVHRSPHATLGYYNNPDATAEAFRGGWFHSGDLGVLSPDGYLTVVDRKKDMIKTGGENVASREIEEVIYELPGVAEVAVVGIDHPRWIEAVAAVIVRKPDATLDSDDVFAHAGRRLAGFKRPKYVVFADELPKNPSGKVLKRELRHRYRELVAQSE